MEDKGGEARLRSMCPFFPSSKKFSVFHIFYPVFLFFSFFHFLFDRSRVTWTGMLLDMGNLKMTIYWLQNVKTICLLLTTLVAEAEQGEEDGGLRYTVPGFSLLSNLRHYHLHIIFILIFNNHWLDNHGPWLFTTFKCFSSITIFVTIMFI